MNDRKQNNDPLFLSNAIILNTDRFDLYMFRAREYYEMADDESMRYFLDQAKHVSNRIRELKRRQRGIVGGTIAIATTCDRITT